jgi:hypothetical protein
MTTKLITGGFWLACWQPQEPLASSRRNRPPKRRGLSSGASHPDCPCRSAGRRSGNVELEREDGCPVYEIEILTADGVEMDVEIDANTGAVLQEIDSPIMTTMMIDDDRDDDKDA